MDKMGSLRIFTVLLVCLSVALARTPKQPGLKIVGGSTASILDVPFMARYEVVGSRKFCGAAIVTQRFLLSTAHCFDSFKTMRREARVVVGSDKLNGGKPYQIETIEVHPMWNPATYDNDIIVIQLRYNLTFNHRVQKIDMAEPDLEIPPGTSLTAIGFGMTETTSSSLRLLKVDLPYVPTDQCNTMLPHHPVTEKMLCAGGLAGKDTCLNDSGGPIFYDKKLVGLTSFATGWRCGVEGRPGVYTRISSLRDFVDRVIDEADAKKKKEKKKEEKKHKEAKHKKHHQ